MGNSHPQHPHLLRDSQLLDGIADVIVAHTAADDAPGAFAFEEIVDAMDFGPLPRAVLIFQQLDMQFARNRRYCHQARRVFVEVAPGDPLS